MESWKNLSESWKSLCNVFLKKGKNPVITSQYGEEGTKFKIIVKLSVKISLLIITMIMV